MKNLNNNVELLKNTYRDNKDRIVFFAGAGASIPLGLMKWKDLLIEMNEKFKTEININKCINEFGYPETASAIYDKIRNKEEYLNFLCDKFDIIYAKARFNSTTKSIVNNFNTILTTNFDSSFEHAFMDNIHLFEKIGYRKINLKTQYLPKFDIVEISTNDATIIYLHGSKDSRKFILRKEEYKAFYCTNYDKNPSELEDFLKEIFKNFSVIFFGFSFDDLDFKKYYEKILTKEFEQRRAIFVNTYSEPYPIELPPHFVFIPEEELKYNLSEVEINNYIKKDNNINWERIFEKINNNEYRFSKFFLNIIEQNSIERELKEELILEYEMLKDNYSKYQYFKKINMKIIPYSKEKIIDVENIFNSLSPVVYIEGEVGNKEQYEST
jgi:hypothetical protein